MAKQSVKQKAAPRSAEVEWVVNSLGELGVRINGSCFFLYKGESVMYQTETHEDGSPLKVRRVQKREFGEVCRPPRMWGAKPETPYNEGEGWILL